MNKCNLSEECLNKVILDLVFFLAREWPEYHQDRIYQKDWEIKAAERRNDMLHSENESLYKRLGY